MGSLYIAFVGPAAVFAASVLLRGRIRRGWATGFAVWTTIILLVTVVFHWSRLMNFHWAPVLVATTDLVAATSAWDSVVWLREHREVRAHRYYLWWALFWGSLLSVAMAQNLAVAWLSVEFSTLSSGAMVADTGTRRALEAAWKYVVIASVGLFLGLVGIVFLYGSVKHQGLGWSVLNYRYLSHVATRIPPMIRQLVTILMVIMFGTKAGLVPFHTWLPDAHSEAPSPVSGLLYGVLLGLSLFTVARFIQAVPTTVGFSLSGYQLLSVFGIVSVLVGSLALLVQRDIKRLLAYSSIEQVGIMAVAIGMGTPQALRMAIWQFVLHAVIKSSLFYGAGHLTVIYRSKRLERIRGLMFRHPVGGAMWALGNFALAGVPPWGLAYTEWTILLGLWNQHAVVVSLLLSLGLVLGFAALSFHLIRTLWSPDGAWTDKTGDIQGIALQMTEGGLRP